jgi:hypothetical protein
MDQHIETAKTVLNVASFAAVVGTVAGWLPPLAALLAIIWYCVLLYDRFIGKNRLGENGE